LLQALGDEAFEHLKHTADASDHHANRTPGINGFFDRSTAKDDGPE